MRVLITGGAGFIGSYTALALLADGHSVSVLDNFLPQVHTSDRNQSATWLSIRDHVDLIEGDVRDRDVLARALTRQEAVFHFAADTGTGQSMYAIRRYCDVNVMGTAALLEAIAESRESVHRIIVASSRAVYGEGLYACPDHGECSPPLRDAHRMEDGRFEPSCPICGADVAAVATRESASVSPASVYAVTKLAQEQLVLAVGAALGISSVALRYQNVYGAGQSLFNAYTGILSIFSREMLAGRDIEIFEDGRESRDFVHVEDVARANVAALSCTESTLISNVGSGVATPILEIARRLATIYGYTGRMPISGRFRVGDIRHNFADLERARKILGIRPRVTLDEGLESFCRWARSQLDRASGVAGAYRDALDEMAVRGLLRG